MNKKQKEQLAYSSGKSDISSPKEETKSAKNTPKSQSPNTSFRKSQKKPFPSQSTKESPLFALPAMRKKKITNLGDGAGWALLKNKIQQIKHNADPSSTKPEDSYQ